ncbi:putative Permease of the major facilitator superfamily MFS_1 [Modestobacter italicus]|uniref:Permease of the major facilitator superfamily MFS_1 n=1 Tax=Modestobacter italicus (strain DSM 44449 / CECT 9708 / BC 501) TaxID=2732864 RepID=I4EVF3_MODI5|nr:MFS transporter [Modestobacter marinus]CCH87366.1 putative Permease of the major facilitator superfamily MFS_1 [Modestobacter marinus]
MLATLCVTEVVSWGALYYAFPVALASITADTGWSASATTAAFSGGLVVSALAGIPVGRWLDRAGPRRVMTAGSLLAAPSAAAIGLAPSLAWFVVAWLVAGVAMAAVFYQAGFAALTRWYGPARVRALTTLTLVAGLASTIFAPLTSLLLDHLSWRATYLVLAGVLAVVTVPLHAFALTPAWTPAPERQHRDGVPASVRSIVSSPGFLLLSGALTLTAFGMYAASLTLIPLLTGRGMSASLAATTLGLLGAGQLLGRIGYAPLTAHTTPTARTVTIVVASALSIGLLAAVPGPAVLLVVLAVFAGAVRGTSTLLQATVVADRWGSVRYGTLSGWFAAPITGAAALAPWAGTALAEAVGSYPATFAGLAALVTTAAVLAAFSFRS